MKPNKSHCHICNLNEHSTKEWYFIHKNRENNVKNRNNNKVRQNQQYKKKLLHYLLNSRKI